MLLTRPFISLLLVSLGISFLNAPRYALLPVYVEADLLRTPIFSAGFKAIFLTLGGLCALPAGSLADRWGPKGVYLIGTLTPALAALVFLSSDVIALAVFCIATYGEGDPTDNALAFNAFMLDKEEELEEGSAA